MPKHLLPSLLAAASGLLFTLAAQDAAPPAAVPPKPANPAGAPKPPLTPAAPPSDPFIRDPAAQKPPKPPARAEAARDAVNLLTTIETWSLSQADFAAILDGPADERAPYDQLEELAKAGKAKLVGLMAINSKSGLRAVVESMNEVRYPTEFDPAGRVGEIAFPVAWEARNAGDTLEVEPILGPDGKTIDVNLVPQVVLFDGFKEWQQPNFHTAKVMTSLYVQSGRPAFLSTASPVAAADAEGDAQVRIRTLRVTAQPALPAPPLGGELVNLRVEFLLYSIDREAARHILNKASDSVQSYAAVRDLLGRNEARLESVSSFVAKSGHRSVNDELFELRFPEGMNSPPSKGPANTPPEARRSASPRAFAVRNTGVTLEVEPVLGPEGRIVMINMVPKVVRFSGMHIAGGVAAKYPPQPVFTVRTLTTSVSSGAGVPVLLGTFNQPGETGADEPKDHGRTVLAYARVTPVRP